VIAALLKQAGLPRAAVDRIVVTGYGRTAFPITRRDRDHLP
jgi:activator of 2-hydroxyglutaryl-CoA dehydratase